MSELLLHERRGPAGAAVVLTLNRPERRNALSIELRDAIADALDELAADESVTTVAFTGAGTTFCAGFDLGEFERAAGDPAYAAGLWASSDRYHHAVLSFPLPTIAAVNGPAIAGGFDLAVLCDLRVASTTARFAHPERSFGDVVYAPLHDLVGGAHARELTMGGATIDAARAHGIGLVGEVVEPDQLDAALDAVIERVCAAPRAVALRLKAKALRRAAIAGDAGTLDL